MPRNTRKIPSPPAIEIIATIGPASHSAQCLRDLLAAGATTFRINLSHARPDWLRDVLRGIAVVAGDTERTLPVIADLPGRKMRTGRLEASRPLPAGATVWVGRDDPAGADWFRIPFDPAHLPLAPAPGTTILLRDGKIRLTVRQSTAAGIVAEVISGGLATDRMGIVFDHPRLRSGETRLPLDLLAVCRAGGVHDYLLSYAEGGDDLAAVRQACRQEGIPLGRLIPKVETRPGLDALDELIEASPAICLARGDLGTQIPLPELAVTECRVLARAAARGKPAILAGDLLPGLIHGPAPTRPELPALVYALAQGAGGLILSDETAVGDHPVEAVRLAVAAVHAWQEYRPER